MVNYIDREQIRRDVLLAREAGAEVLIVFIHWGDEYVRLPNSFQKETADYLISLGVDIIFGSHPHVLQPMERRPVTLDDGTEKEAFIIYSLGNFLSNQRDRYRDSGVIVDVDVIKDYDRGTIELGEVSYTPTWVYKYTENGRTDYRILPAGQFLDGNDELDLGKTDLERVQAVWSETVSHLGTEGAKANR
jgi:poly-gamma-glutamate synthesis protein (capsule biosynthesis protein)